MSSLFGFGFGYGAPQAPQVLPVGEERTVYNITDFGVTPSSDATADRAAFELFNTSVLRVDPGPVTLLVNSPPKNYVITGGAFLWMAASGADLLVEGAGSAINKGFIGVSPGWPFFDSLDYSALIQTVAAGSTTVQVITLADHSKFAVGDWIAISSIDIQAFGYPQNNHHTQYAEITAINTGSGVITIDRELADEHLSTLPLYLLGNETYPYQGGPATIWLMPADWNCKIHIKGLDRTDTDNFGFGAREIIIEDMDCPNGGSPDPSASQTIDLIRCSTNAGTIFEEDKGVELLRHTDCDDYNMHAQSTSIMRRIIDGGTTHVINGLVRYDEIRNHVTPTILFGGGAFGYTETSLIEDCTISAVNASMRARVKTQFTVSSPGVLRIPKNALDDLSHFVPGAKRFICDSTGVYNYGWPHTFVTITEDGTYAYATLDRSDSIPAPNSGDGSRYAMHPCYDVSVYDCVGCADIVNLSNAPKNRPLFEYGYQELTGNFGNGASLPGVRNWGRLVSISINVLQADTGAVGTVSLKAMGGIFDAGCRTIAADGTTLSYYFPTVNLKIAGERVITPGNVTGTQTGDSNLALGSNWFCHQWKPYLAANVGGNSAGQFAIVQITVETNQDS